MHNVPSWWEFVLLALAAFRVCRLIGWDEITKPWRDRFLLSKLRRTSKLRTLVKCPWCLGWWVGLLLWAAWLPWPHATLLFCTPWAISGAIGLIARNLDP